MDEKDFTVDSIWIPEIKIQQSRHGYRFALDAVLLAHFIRAAAHENVMEIGCGNGVIIILLSHLQQFKKLIGIEIQPELARLSRDNIKLNGIRNVEILEGDARNLDRRLPSKSLHLIYSNPPYRKAGSGRLNPSREKAIARHEIELKLENLFDIAEKFLCPDGRLTLILPEFRESDFVKLCSRYGFFLNERRYVHSFDGQPPAFFLGTASRQNSGFLEMPPLIIYDRTGEYTEEMQRMLTRKTDPET
jgi:tRNA1Val (adenine37-N6)-methyltransferase